jgi:CRISPR/Cas system-associated protein Cas10 (large subunit of type III CRISPR-Cas system)
MGYESKYSPEIVKNPEIFSRLLGSVLSIIDISFLESAANNLEFAVWLISHFRPFAALGLYFWAKCKNGL